MATQAERDMAREMFNLFATGFDPGDAGIDFWANKIANQGFDSTLAEFLYPADQTAPRSAVMFADPEYQTATGTTPASQLSDEEFRQAMGLTGEQNRMELDAELRNWYDIYTGGRGMSTPVDAYVSMLNGRDGTYLSQDYNAAKQKMLDDAVKSGLYEISPGASYSTGAYNRWLQTQQANNAVTGPTGAATATNTGSTGGNAFNNNMRGSTQIDGTASSPSGTALDLFSVYATNFTPDQTALDFWNNKIATLGYEGARQEFLRPSDVNAPRNQLMFADPDYVSWARANNYQIPGQTTQPGTTPGGTTVTPPGTGVGTPPLTQEGMMTYGGLNFFGTPLQGGYYSERGFEPGFTQFGQYDPGTRDAASLFNLYATDFTPDQTALDFWNNKINTLGYQSALNEFLNPSDINAPRNQVMFGDPDYAIGREQLATGFAPSPVMPQPTFRSGVAGYTPLAPTGFQFGVNPVTAPRYVFQPGVFNPGYIDQEGNWFPTAPGEPASPMAPGTIDFNLTPSGAEKG